MSKKIITLAIFLILLAPAMSQNSTDVNIDLNSTGLPEFQVESDNFIIGLFELLTDSLANIIFTIQPSANTLLIKLSFWGIVAYITIVFVSYLNSKIEMYFAAIKLILIILIVSSLLLAIIYPEAIPNFGNSTLPLNSTIK